MHHKWCGNVIFCLVFDGIFILTEGPKMILPLLRCVLVHNQALCNKSIKKVCSWPLFCIPLQFFLCQPDSGHHPFSHELDTYISIIRCIPCNFLQWVSLLGNYILQHPNLTDNRRTWCGKIYGPSRNTAKPINNKFKLLGSTMTASRDITIIMSMQDIIRIDSDSAESTCCLK